MRSWVLLPLLAAPLAAQNAPEDPFAPPEKDSFRRSAVPGTRERVTESLALIREDLARRTPDAATLERAHALLLPLGRVTQLIPTVRKALEHSVDPGPLSGLLGDLLVRAGGVARPGRVRIVFGPGGRPNLRRPDANARALYEEAVLLLRIALAADASDVRSIRNLAAALEALDREGNKEEVEELRNRAVAVELRAREEVAAPVDLLAEVYALRSRAEELEQVEADPDHAAALDLRRKALVYEFCTHTIPFAYEPAIFEPVSLLAPEHLVRQNLTRTYLSKDGEIKSVAVVYHMPPLSKRVELVAALAVDETENAAAVLLSLLRRAHRGDPLAESVLAGLAEGRHQGLREHFPRLLGTALAGLDRTDYPDHVRRAFVRLAGLLGFPEAAPVLRAFLARDDDVYAPLGVADALGRIGRPEDADALVTLAKDEGKDIHFRREAVYALGRFAPGRLAAFEDSARLEIAVAAARYRAAPGDAARGRILAGLGREHEIDEAARYSADLDIEIAIPLLETFLADHADHYAAESVRAALARLGVDR
jgi:tetratricopeptide (TPR) repeat protein